MEVKDALPSYGKVTGELLDELKEIVGDGNIITEGPSMKDYSHDEMAEDIAITHMPDVVVKPGSVEEVSTILKLANAHLIPVTPRGAGTGLSGGAVPVYGGIVLCLERMNRVLEVDENNLMMTVEAGAPLMSIYKALEGTGLFFPPHPGDESAQIGASVATNAGGARTVKYGVMRDYVKGAEIVLPTGEILNLGGKLMKNNTGYSLLHLLIGSEGTLAVFTKVILRLLPKPKESMILIMQFNEVGDAISAVPDILKSGEIPLGLEYLERECITPTEKLTGETWPAKGEAFLMVVVVGKSEDELYAICQEMARVGEGRGASDILLADKKRDQEAIMNIRSNVYEGLKPETLEILDVGVPPSRIAEFVRIVKKVASEENVFLPVYGHAADGNVHVHVMKTGLGENWRDTYLRVKRRLFEAGKALGGVITAEHGVGAQKIPDLHYTLTRKEIELMKALKRVFDPNNILNPGKVLPPDL